MNDKSNILAGLIGRPSSGGPSGRQVDQQGSNKENSQQQVSTPSNSRPTSVLSQRPQSSGSGRQHKLKQRFTVIRKLGKGTYGKVQLAINKETGQEVAIKTIKKTKIENEHDLQRVRREIQIMSSIEHPHIIHIYEVFENKDKIVLVMQYAPGGELYEYVSQSKVLEESEARRLFRQVATAVYYCHENKICHRDLKLENILLDEKNNAKLADFGLSNVFDKRRHLLNTFCGSPLYASPEIVRGSPYEGPEVDCWSLGVILYTLVYGAMPFDGSNFKLLVKQIIGASYFEPKQKSQASALIRRLLCVDPAQRATIADICSDPWVNGSVSSPCRSPLEASAGQHLHSLLKVAQDMANLTPVRLDILLALAPVSPPPRPPPPTLGEKRTIAPMEVDDEKKQFELHDSPVASYVVRNLEPPISTEMAPKFDEQPMMELAIEQTKPEDQSLMEPEEETMFVELMVEGAREEAKVDVIQEDQDDKIQPTASKEANNVAMDLDKPVNTQGIDLSRDQSLGELHSNKLDRKSVDKESPPLTDNQETGDNPMESESVAGAQEVEEIVEGETVKMEEAINEEQTELIDKTEEETCPATDMPTVEQNKENQEIPIESAGEVEKVADGGTVGEKKKKKKVIVVKKKKKKTTGEVDGEKAKKEDPASEQAKVSPESPAPKKLTTKASKAPGKVRIPDTFTEPQPEGPPPKVNLETRRQSALITDVSQKLLQQQPQIPSSSISPSEQVQLASVRVSDKKNDFERRASLMVEETHARSSKPSSPQPYDRLNSATDMEEPKSIEALIESIKLLADIEQTIAESPQTAAIGPLDTASPQPIAVEGSSTPTIDDELTTAHRSNSDETIKDEDRAVTNKNKRSTLTLDLGEGSQQVASELPLRPAPIARSYKKVTFTKDGACITETGKIYAHQAEDGSVHRVKRKSKVTHYPADSAEQRQENEQVVVEMGGQLDGDTWQHLTETSTTRRHLSGTSIAKMKPQGKLIMPNELFDFGGDPLPDQLQNKSKPSSQPLGRTESNSSCSSGSTDVFDDIFDTWTGAVSLFHRPAFGGDPTSSFGGQWRRLHRPKRTPSTGRCESTEPQIGRWAPRGSFKKRTEQTSGYESDAAAESSPARPASALAGAVGRFGSSNLLDSARLFQATPLQDSLETDDFFNNDLFSSQHQQSIAQQHLELRRRLTKQHKQLWKGSNPTLFDTSLDEERRWSERQRPRARLWQFLRPAETELDVEHSDSRVSRHQAEQTAIGGGLPRPPRPQQVQKQQQVASSSASEQQIDNQLNQSQSSSSFLRQSIALDASPRQRDTTGMQLPRCGIPRADSNSVQKSSSSASKASLITSKMADIQLGSTQITKQQQSFSSASFIQLKRTSSSSAWSVNKSQQQQEVEKSQKVQTCSSSTTSKLMSTSDESSSNFWDGRVSPMILEGGQSSRQMSAGQTPLEAADSRVQSWLQESSGNLSLSSASQSSTSDTVNSGTNLFGHSAVPKHLLPPVSPLASQLHSRASEQTVLITSSSSSLKKSSTGDDPVAESTKMSKLVGRTTSGSSISKGSGNKQLTTTQTVVSRTLRSPVEVLEELALESEAQAANFDEMKKKRQIVGEQQVSARISPQLQQESGHKSPVLSRSQFATTASLLQKESQSDRLLSQLDELDSLSGGELESRSSSSLLDQLRSKGYRSMINQRMGGQLVNQQAQGELGAGSSNGSLVESSSRLVSMTTTTTTTITTTSSGIQEESQTSSQMSDELTNLPISNIQHESEPVGSDEHKAPRDSEESNVNEVIPDTVNDQTVVEEEEDEDIREAKANIKTQLDRVKETELFLQSMHQEEENMERQRQQLFLFNNLMLSSKLGLNRTAPFRPGTSIVLGGSESGESYGMSSALSNIDGLRSAPVQSGLIGNGLALHQQPARESQPITNGSVPSGGSLALSFEPSYTPASLTRQHTPSNYGQLSLDYSSGDFQLRPARDPLEPVQPLEAHHWNNHRAHNSALDNRPDWMQSRGRNKSQLSEQFADYNPYRRNSTKVSHLSDGIEPTLPASQNVFFPSRRSVSQLRYAPNRLSQPALASQMMSEYRSAYGASSSIRQAKSPLPDRSSDDDDDMSAYRVSSYVPKVDLTTVERPSRSFQRRSYSELDSQVSSYSPTARSIHRDSITRARSPSCTNGRRRSCLDQSTCAQETPNSAPVQMEPNSRLSELEQRLQENKRRREELLFGSLSSSEAQPRSRRAESSEPAVAPTTGAVDQEHKPKATGVLSRPSRLESMEARIKRKSYCIRVEQDDQNEKQSQLRAMNERWRPSLSRLGSSRGSTSESSTGGRTALRGSSCERSPGGSSRRATNGFTTEGESLPATSCNQMEV